MGSTRVIIRASMSFLALFPDHSTTSMIEIWHSTQGLCKEQEEEEANIYLRRCRLAKEVWPAVRR
jgi:hypothetical protein